MGRENGVKMGRKAKCGGCEKNRMVERQREREREREREMIDKIVRGRWDGGEEYGEGMGRNGDGEKWGGDRHDG